MKKVFIDGGVGTTGLKIAQRLSKRDDLTLLSLPEDKRKDALSRKDMLNQCDVAFLCLPDDAAVEAVAMVENPSVVVIDASTAHRTHPDWAYGLPELSEQRRAAIASSKRIAVPGCHASGFVALVYPLVESGLLPRDALIACHSLTGYSGGGKKMIAQYEGNVGDRLLSAPRQYALSQTHKHLKEMRAVCGLTSEPVFCPIVAPYYSGMEVTIPLFLGGALTFDALRDVYRQTYQTGVVRYVEHADEDGFLSAAALSGRDDMEISVFGNDARALLIARFDNLGKGASGAAIQCMNLVIGAEETRGLVVGEGTV